MDAGELVFAALVTDVSPTSVRPGSSGGVPFTARVQTSNANSFAEDITSSAAGAQHGTATLGNTSAEWYAVCAVFHPYPATAPVPPSTPTDLAATGVASTRVALSWSPSGGSVAGYTVYRNGAAIGTTGPDTTIFLDAQVTPSTTHAYSVDAFDLANDHSAPSAPLTVTTPAQSPEFVQGVAASPASRSSSYTLTLRQPVLAGDLLVGWFSQYNASGQVRVSDNVNGSWTRSVATTWGGAGDIALYYRENSAAAPSGLTITVSASASAYLQEAIANYRHVATVGALDQAVVARGAGTYASVGPTAAVPAGELVVAAVLTGGQPRWAIPGSSALVPYLLTVHNGSDASDLEDILSSAAGPQQGSLTLGSATNWYMVLATFLPATPPTTTSTTTTTRPTTTTTTTTTTSSTTTTSPPATTTTTTGGPTTTTVASTTTTTSTSSTTTTTLAACLPTGSACRTNADCCSTSCRKKGSTKVCTSNIRTVFMILMENTDWSSVKNSASAPYINRTLLPIASHAERYYNPPNLHPSLPNYLWLEAGTNFAILDNNLPAQNHQGTSSNHLVNLLEAAGISWKAYQEDEGPGAFDGTDCPFTHEGNFYDVNHNPFVYFDDVTGNMNPSAPRCLQHVRPYSEFLTDLGNNTVARYNFITPHLCHDMHNPCAPLNDPVLQGDTWLSTEVPKILASQAYRNNGVLFITWDEGDSVDGPIGMIVLSPKGKGAGYSNTIAYDHSSTLRTVQEIFGVTPLGGAATATDLRDLFVSFP